MLVCWLSLFLLVATILWKTSSLAKRWIKFTIYISVASSVTLLIPIWLFRRRDTRNALLPSAGFRRLCKVLQLKYSVEGEENIVKDSGSVVLINHQSILDLIVLSCLWPLIPNCTVVSKKVIWYYQPIGLAFWLCGAIFIDRTRSTEAQATVNKTGETMRKRQSRVLLFPEGKRNLEPKLVPFLKGAFHLAVASQCPIQPVAVSRFTFLGKNDKFEAGEIRIRILPAIQTAGCTSEDVVRLRDETYNVISENVDDLSKGIEPSQTT